MAMWHCPHCGTPQAETARCWVCRRSSTTCSTCRHFRRAVAQGIGYCGLDRSRRPLRGDELRGCWVGATAEAPPAAGPPAPVPSRLRLTFVPLDDLTAWTPSSALTSAPSSGLTTAPSSGPIQAPTLAYERGTLFDLDGGGLEPASQA